MTRKRPLTPEEEQLWRQVMQGTEPLGRIGKEVPVQPERARPARGSRGGVPRAPPRRGGGHALGPPRAGPGPLLWSARLLPSFFWVIFLSGKRKI